MYHDALLPTAERYASPAYRRIAPRIQTHLLGWGDLVELVAFVECVGLNAARWIFHWSDGQADVYASIRAHVQGLASVPDVRASFGVDEGLAVLAAMRDGGWRNGKLPWVVEASIKQLAHEHKLGRYKVARMLGLTYSQAKRILGGPSRAKTEQIAAYAALAL